MVVAALLGAVLAAPAGSWHFTEVAASAGVLVEHDFVQGINGAPRIMAGGAAAGDLDGDGWPDLLTLRGDLDPPLVAFRNRGDGRFDDVTAAWGLRLPGGVIPNGVVLGDVDGNGWLDVLLGGQEGFGPRLFLNQGGHFVDATAASGLASMRDSWSLALGDIDADGDLDLALGHWSVGRGGAGHLWQNDGQGHFRDIGGPAGIDAAFTGIDWSFTPSFGDLDGDGRPELLFAADFGTSRVFHNQGGGRFVATTGPEITDENGMGSALGDFDNDGDLDWFVASIWDPNGVAESDWGVTGNRLYRNRGDGRFEDATETAGVRQGYWGWGSSFGDFDNDGFLDIFHVNGFSAFFASEFHEDPARLFVNRGDGTFTERSAELGVADTGQGRGIVCFDYDRDGDLDLFVQNNQGPTRLFRNDGGNAGHFLAVRLLGRSPNTSAVGARLYLRAGGRTQMRELAAGSNYLSANPIEAHFGLGGATRIDELRVRWPDGSWSLERDLAVDQLLVLGEPGIGVAVPLLGSSSLLLLSVVLAACGVLALRLRA